MNLIPVGDKLIVRPHSREKKVGSIIIPDSAKRPPLMGTVLAAGPGRHSESGQFIPSPVKTGQMVIFNRYSGNEISIEEGAEPILIMSTDDVQAVYDPDTIEPSIEDIKRERDDLDRRWREAVAEIDQLKTKLSALA